MSRTSPPHLQDGGMGIPPPEAGWTPQLVRRDEDVLQPPKDPEFVLRSSPLKLSEALEIARTLGTTLVAEAAQATPQVAGAVHLIL